MKREEMIAACYATPTGRLGMEGLNRQPARLVVFPPVTHVDPR